VDSLTVLPELALLPVADGENLEKGLAQFERELSNGGSRATAHDALNAYVATVNEACRMLRGKISTEDLHRWVLTPRYQLLTSGDLPGPQIWSTLQVELDDRKAELQALLELMAAARSRWEGLRLVVMDTSAFYQLPTTLDTLGGPAQVRAQVTGLAADQRLRLLVPMVVVDELDRLKENNDQQRRWRAGQTIRILHDQLDGATPSGLGDHVSIEVLVDHPRHKRLPLEDDEVLDRALLVKMLSRGQVAVMSGDWGQLWRAKALGLDAIALPSRRHQPEFEAGVDEPPPAPPRKPRAAVKPPAEGPASDSL